MANYLLVYHGGGMPETDAARAQVMEAWGRWFQELGAAVVDGGNPVSQTVTVAVNGSTASGGGANPATGYSIIRAESLDAAVKLAKGCPVPGAGASIEVCETVNAM